MNIFDLKENIRECFPVCPHCGHKHEDCYWEMQNGLNECASCGKKFMLESETLYTTTEVKN